MNMPADSLYLDTLPAHPRPQALESLNSYLKRLAQANGIHYVATFSHLIGIAQPERLLELNPPPNWGQLGQATQTTEKELLALTPHFLVHKFGREQTPGRFLANSVSLNLRWCPRCLAEHGYYRLPWYFLHLQGCPQHGLRLLDICPHCHSRILLKSSSLHMTCCPHCTGDLRQAATTSLTQQELASCQQQWDNLVYLLTPQDWQMNPTRKVADAMRQRLGYIRRLQNLKAYQLAQVLGISKHVIGALENETQSGMGETFADYLRYVDYFGLTLQAVFCESARTGYIHKDVLYADNLLEEAREIVAQLKQQRIPVTQKQVAQGLGHAPSMLRKYPKIHALLRSEAAIRDKRTTAYENNLYEQAHQVIGDLNNRKQRISKRKIALHLGYDSAKIHKHYPCVEQLLVSAVNQYQQQRRAQLRRAVEQTLQEFRQQETRITQKKIAQVLGVSAVKLGDDPYIRSLIAKQQQAAHDFWFNALKERISNEMNLLLEQRIFVSQTKFLNCHPHL